MLYLKTETKKIFYLILKVLAGLMLCYVLYNRLHEEFQKFSWDELSKKFGSLFSWILLSGAVILMLLNWLLESLKWKTIIDSTIMPMSFFKAFKSVLSGVAFGNLAPGRATEFAGKILFLPADRRASATYLHFVNGIIQLLVTLILGITSLLIIFFQEKNQSTNQFTVYVLIGSTLLILLLSAFITKPVWFYELLKKNEKIKKHLNSKIEISRPLLFKLSIYSFLRYLTFSIQFFLLIEIFFDHVPVFDVCLGVCLYYLLTTIIPMFSAIEAFMRGGIAILIFSPIEKSSMNIFIASTFLWIINIVAPSIFGYLFFLLNKNSKNTEE